MPAFATHPQTLCYPHTPHPGSRGCTAQRDTTAPSVPSRRSRVFEFWHRFVCSCTALQILVVSFVLVRAYCTRWPLCSRLRSPRPWTKTSGSCSKRSRAAFYAHTAPIYADFAAVYVGTADAPAIYSGTAAACADFAPRSAASAPLTQRFSGSILAFVVAILAYILSHWCFRTANHSGTRGIYGGFCSIYGERLTRAGTVGGGRAGQRPRHAPLRSVAHLPLKVVILAVDGSKTSWSKLFKVVKAAVDGGQTRTDFRIFLHE